MENKPHKLFISHSSKDAEYMKAFVDLLVAIGVHKNQITCTSVPQCNIPVGCNIYDWLAKQFQTSDLHVVYAFSDNYYSSVATLNEMGAAWVMRCKWTGLLLPGFIFDKLAGCIDKNQICIKLDDPDIITLKQRLRQFRDDIIKEFGLESINEDEWEEKRDDFLDKIRIIAQDDEMIDIHAHILPGIDDGAEDMYDTLEMARMAADSGVDKIIATPHCNIPGMYGNYFGREYIDRYESVVRAVREEKIPIEILPGMEVFSTEDLPELIVNHKIMPLNQSRYILMEFAFDEDPEFADSILKRVEEVGARPVIAHAERYEFIQDYPQIAYRWFRKGYVIQANKGSFLGRFGGGPKRAADSLLRHNLISVIASDAHSPLQRTPYMLDAYEELSSEYSENHLDVLFQYNPARLCDNREILRLEPVPYSGR